MNEDYKDWTYVDMLFRNRIKNGFNQWFVSRACLIPMDQLEEYLGMKFDDFNFVSGDPVQMELFKVAEQYRDMRLDTKRCFPVSYDYYATKNYWSTPIHGI